jgi:hypothetical protein
MENAIVIKTQIEIAAQKIIQQVMIGNEALEKQIEEGVKRAFDNFDFSAEVERAVRSCIERAIKESSDWGAISKMVHEKAETIIQEYIQSSFDKFRKDFKQ